MEDDGEAAQATADAAGLIIYAVRKRTSLACPFCCSSDINALFLSSTRASCLCCGWCLPHSPRPRSRVLPRAADYYPKSLSRIFGLRFAAAAALPRQGVAGNGA